MPENNSEGSKREDTYLGTFGFQEVADEIHALVLIMSRKN